MVELVRKQYVDKPKDTNFVHASTIAFTAQGIALAFFGGSREGNPDVGIYHTTVTASEVLPIRSLSRTAEEAHWNPVLFPAADANLMLFYKVGNEISSWRTMKCVSADDGNTFCPPEPLIAGDRGGRGPVRNKPIRLSNTAILAPASLEHGVWTAFTDLSPDNGSTWIKSNDISIRQFEDALEMQGVPETVSEKAKSMIPVSEQSFAGRGIIQPSVWESQPDHVHMLLRSTEGRIYRSDSQDGGMSWCAAYPTNLPNNNSGIDLVRLGDGRLVLAHNPIGKNWGPRTPLTLSISSDNGESWKSLIDLETGPGEYSYPAIITRSDTVVVSYTFNRSCIAVCELKIEG